MEQKQDKRVEPAQYREDDQERMRQAMLFSLVESGSDYMAASDHEGRMFYMNPAGRKLLGIPFDMDISQLDAKDLYSPENYNTVIKEVLPHLEAGGKWAGTIYLQHYLTREIIPFHGDFVSIKDPRNNHFLGHGASLRDLREEKALKQRMIDNEQELERLVELRTDELKRANIDLNIVNQNLEQFAYVASHDLQEPLRKINMFSALLQDKYANELNETGVRNLGIIRNAATRMTTLIQDLLAFSRVSRQDHLFEKVDLHQIFQQAIADVEVLIQQKGAKVDYDSLCCVRGIPLHMTQLFQNLLSNALKFSKADEAPVIRVSSRLMEASEVAANPQLQNGTTYCEIKVQDNGIGFAPTYARKIFVIFQRLHGRGEYEGSGIGLALCQKIVIAHHGIIYAESAEKEGATFTVILPAYT